MSAVQPTLLTSVRDFYNEKIARLGPTPAGADFNAPQAQTRRFDQMLRLFDFSRPFSLIDYGCGYGAFLPYLLEHGAQIERYVGYDLAPEMLAHAQRMAFTGVGIQIIHDEAALEPADLLVASGIFNVKFDAKCSDWETYILSVLDRFDRLGKCGFAFNMLTKYSDADHMRDDLYYGDPTFFFNHCKRHYARNVALLHDYDLYDWTIGVRKA